MNIKDIKINPNNPRYMTEVKKEKLKNNIKDFPKMMKLRPIVIDKNNVIIGGNMRYLMLKDLGYTEIPEGWVVKADDLTDDERRRFIITDNIPYGDWDEDMLANEWEMEELQEWGVNLDELDDSINIEEDIEIEEEINEYKMVHILISIKPDYYNEISNELQIIQQKIIGKGEYEQASN